MKSLKILNINHKFVLFFFIIVLFNYINTGIIFSIDNQYEEKTYYLKNDNYQNIPRSYFEFLENKDHNLTINQLKNSTWSKELKTNQSYYDGFWIKLVIHNQTENQYLGIHHHWNFEKKLIYINSLGEIIYPFLDSIDEEYKHRDNNRIWFDYKIVLPKNEKTIIYNFFRSQPLDRSNARPNGLDRIDIGTWEEIEFRANYRTQSFFVYIAVFFSFGMYFLFYFFISKEKSYLWIGLAFIGILLTPVIFLLSSIYGIRFNFMYGPAGNTIVAIILIQFFRNILLIRNNFPKIDQLFKYINIFYILCFLFYLYDSIDYPNGEYFTNLIKYPFSILGPGTIPIFLAFVPVFFVGLISITLTYILWRKGDSSAKYLLMTFCIPVIIPIIQVFFDLYTIEVINSNILGFRFISNAIQNLFLFLIPIFIGLALAERGNQFKRDTIDLLERTVDKRTLELSEANQLITESIKSASKIQNAILPKIELDKFGFNEFEYLWEPRDIVGGDFYWIDKKNDWTCFVMADCTGHGIPGAFMTLISSTLLDRIKSLEDLSQPERILNQLDELLEETLKLKEYDVTNFGMDAGVCCFSRKKNLLLYSGAKMNLYIKHDNIVQEYKGDKISLGYSQKPHPLQLSSHQIDVSEDSSFYIFSDGITDQIGGPKNIMYGKKRILNIISKNSKVEKTIFDISKDLESYQQNNKRRDDLSLFGFSIA